VRIRYQTSGGLAYLPGLQKPVEIDAEALDAATRDELLRLVDAAGFFELPATLGSIAKGSADHATDTLTIEDEGRSHSVRLLSSVSDGPLRELLRAVRVQVKASRAEAKDRKQGG
jgi:hypothetical protein